jgi:hypothetical protein
LGLTNLWEEELERGKDPPHTKTESGQKFLTFAYWTWYQILLYFFALLESNRYLNLPQFGVNPNRKNSMRSGDLNSQNLRH